MSPPHLLRTIARSTDLPLDTRRQWIYYEDSWIWACARLKIEEISNDFVDFGIFRKFCTYCCDLIRYNLKLLSCFVVCSKISISHHIFIYIFLFIHWSLNTFHKTCNGWHLMLIPFILNINKLIKLKLYFSVNLSRIYLPWKICSRYNFTTTTLKWSGFFLITSFRNFGVKNMTQKLARQHTKYILWLEM